MASNEPETYDLLVDHYRQAVSSIHPDLLHSWPVVSGFNAKIGEYRGVYIYIFISTRNSGYKSINGIGDIPKSTVRVEEINKDNAEAVRLNIERAYRLGPDDAVVFWYPDGVPRSEFEGMLRRHEQAMGLAPMKIFLSHKGADKPLVREFEQTLRLLGFDPWLDELAMTAGSELERALLRGFNDSCAVVFFVTPNYVDENYLASEVDYAISEKRKKGDKFSIITIVLNDEQKTAKVPDLLHKYVWKTPSNHLEALREIIKALPVVVGDVRWKHP